MPANSGIRNNVVRGTSSNREAQNSSKHPSNTGGSAKEIKNASLTHSKGTGGPRTNIKAGK